jgi:hypothetical protein
MVMGLAGQLSWATTVAGRLAISAAPAAERKPSRAANLYIACLHIYFYAGQARAPLGVAALPSLPDKGLPAFGFIPCG